LSPEAKMPRRTQKERVAESTRRLADSALELIAEQGFERTTAAEIGERAGYSRNMVRDRYGSKEALLESLLAREFGDRLQPAIRRERGGSGLVRVLGQLDALLDAVEAEPEIMKAMIVLSFESPAAIRGIAPWLEELISRYEDEMARNLALGTRDGSVRVGLDAGREAEVFVSYGIGLCFRYVAFRDAFDFPAEIVAWRDRLEQRYRPPLASMATGPDSSAG
jgi:AcrR family transcriptional regulator